MKLSVDVCGRGRVGSPSKNQAFVNGPLGLWRLLPQAQVLQLAVVSLVNMFSHTVGSLLILMLFSLATQKLFVFMRSHLFLLSFMSLALVDVSVRMLLPGMSEIFLPMFSSRTFMVLQIIFKSFTHLEFIFVYGVSW